MAKLDWGFGWVVNESKNNYHLELVREALLALGKGVRACSKRIKDANASGSEEHAEAVMDEECDVIETLLGSAFTVCQTHITRVHADVCLIHRLAGKPRNGAPGVKLTTTTTKKADVMAYGCARVAGTAVTKVDALNALANYFKHRDEWPADWTKAAGQAKTTISIIEPIGLTQGSTGNLRQGARALDNPSFSKMGVFADLLEKWHEQVMDDYAEELKNKGLIK